MSTRRRVVLVAALVLFDAFLLATFWPAFKDLPELIFALALIVLVVVVPVLVLVVVLLCVARAWRH